MQLTKETFELLINTATVTSSNMFITPEIIKKYLPNNFFISNNSLIQICAALKSGKNIILSGPPGTGKSTIAKAILSAAQELHLSANNNRITTATSDWSTFDTIGGYFPDSQGGLHFTSGVVLESICDNSWLLIDEINRADIDKSFGQLFTVLSDRTTEVFLPFKEDNKNIKIKFSDEPSTSTEYNIHSSWRIISTMNDFDKLSLYDISYAFMRRFAIIEIPVPDAETIHSFIDAICTEFSPDISDSLKHIHADCEGFRPIGPSIYQDISEYIKECVNTFALSYDVALEQGFDLFVRPQLQGILEDNTIDQILNKSIRTNIKQEIAIDNLPSITEEEGDQN